VRGRARAPAAGQPRKPQDRLPLLVVPTGRTGAG
jgi:hypothetical protein